MIELKLIFTGPPGVGKTTAISTISEIPPVTTDRPVTDQLAKIKKTTTVAFDYGQVTLEGGQMLRLYGTPGQQRFEFIWRIIIKIIRVSGKSPLPETLFYHLSGLYINRYTWNIHYDNQSFPTLSNRWFSRRLSG